jgi:hypothetical protein
MLRSILYFLYFLIILYFVRLVSRSIGQLFGPGSSVRRSGGPPPPRSRQAEDLVHDRICNTYVPRSRALTAKVGEREEYFCCEACLERARAAVPRAS